MMFLSGWKITEILDELTFDQVQFVIQCMLTHKSDIANFVMDSISHSLGGKVSKKSSSGTRNNNLRTENQSMKKDPNAALNKLKSLGFHIHESKE